MCVKVLLLRWGPVRGSGYASLPREDEHGRGSLAELQERIFYALRIKLPVQIHPVGHGAVAGAAANTTVRR